MTAFTSPCAVLALAFALVLLVLAVMPVSAQILGQAIAAPLPQSATQKEVPLDSAIQDKLVEPVSAAASPQPNQTELDLYLDYKAPSGALKGLWFRCQPNWEWNAGGGTTTQLRAIIYWEVPLI